jgi:ABC-type branched-subunit amino acid transport system ATPase component
VLEVDRLTKSFGGFTAVGDVQMTVERGAIHALIGPNGAGKTTLFNLVTGVLAPSAGRLRFEGDDITGWRADRITARGMARTFQNIRLFREMTAVENVMVGAHCRTSGGFLAAVARLPGRLGRGERETIRRADELLDLVALTAKRDVAAAELTLVEQRRLEIARALATGPRLLLLDEPAAGLAADEIKELIVSLRELRDRDGLTIVLVEHIMELVMSVCDRITVLSFGEVLAEGPPEHIRTDARVIDAYLGKQPV